VPTIEQLKDAAEKLIEAIKTWPPPPKPLSIGLSTDAHLLLDVAERRYEDLEKRVDLYRAVFLPLLQEMDLPRTDEDFWHPSMEAVEKSDHPLAPVALRVREAIKPYTEVLADIHIQLEMLRLVAGKESEAWMGYEFLGEALALIRIQARLSQAELADKIGISKGQVGHIEKHRRERRISVDDLFKWVSACGRIMRWRWMTPEQHVAESRGRGSGWDTRSPDAERRMSLEQRVRGLRDDELQHLEVLLEGIEARRKLLPASQKQ
jgi:transcriptional regulator with XRE-family HTH domain